MPLQLVAKVVALLDALAQHRRHVVVTWVGVVRNEDAEVVQTLVHATIALLPLRPIGLVLLVGVWPLWPSQGRRLLRLWTLIPVSSDSCCAISRVMPLSCRGCGEGLNPPADLNSNVRSITGSKRTSFNFLRTLSELSLL